jgi:galactose-1-phosphate uridylyltransferase
LEEDTKKETKISELRQDVVTGDWVVISTIRAKRPDEFAVQRSQPHPSSQGSQPLRPDEYVGTPPLSKGEGNHAFFRIVRAGFSAKRKTLLNNLSAGLQLDKKEVEKILKKVGLAPTQRAQELSVENWKKLAEELITELTL